MVFFQVFYLNIVCVSLALCIPVLPFDDTINLTILYEDYRFCVSLVRLGELLPQPYKTTGSVIAFIVETMVVVERICF